MKQILYILSILLLLLPVRLFSATAFAGTETDSIRSADEQSWKTYYRQGINYREHGNSFRALQQLVLADSLFRAQNAEGRSDDTIVRELAKCYFVRGKYQQCISLCHELMHADTLSDDLFLLARCYEKTEQDVEAIRYQMMAAQKDIENVNNLLSLTKKLVDTDHPSDALEILNRYYAIDSANNVVNAARAYALHKAGKYQQAIEAYEKLRSEGDSTATTNFYLGLSYLRFHDVPSAYDYLQLAVDQTQRNNPNILSRLGVAELQMALGNVYFTNPKKDWGLVYDVNNDSTTHSNLMQLLADINQQGIADIEEAIGKMQPNQETLFILYNSIGNFYALNRAADAIPYYQKALKASPNHANIYYQLAYCYHKLKDYRNEMKSYEQYVQVAGSDEDPNALEYARERIEECRKVLFMKQE